MNVDAGGSNRGRMEMITKVMQVGGVEEGGWWRGSKAGEGASGRELEIVEVGRREADGERGGSRRA